MVKSAVLEKRITFAHPSEEEIASLLDFYGVTWEYEPHTFPLEHKADGQLLTSFTPDFYLPDYDLYLEITTIKPTLANRKNRKIRLLRERFPEVQIKLLNLRDLRELMFKYRGSRETSY
ncbi:MAG: hypothetical protein ABJA67_03580 [Chthonomonadales bacterium]